jgi:hypothetical protein
MSEDSYQFAQAALENELVAYILQIQNYFFFPQTLSSESSQQEIFQALSFVENFSFRDFIVCNL